MKKTKQFRSYPQKISRSVSIETCGSVKTRHPIRYAHGHAQPFRIIPAGMGPGLPFLPPPSVCYILHMKCVCRVVAVGKPVLFIQLPTGVLAIEAFAKVTYSANLVTAIFLGCLVSSDGVIRGSGGTDSCVAGQERGEKVRMLHTMCR